VDRCPVKIHILDLVGSVPTPATMTTRYTFKFFANQQLIFQHVRVLEKELSQKETEDFAKQIMSDYAYKFVGIDPKSITVMVD
jgi:hypothetical protein